MLVKTLPWQQVVLDTDGAVTILDRDLQLVCTFPVDESYGAVNPGDVHVVRTICETVNKEFFK